MKKWGFLRETTKSAEKAGVDKNTGLHRTGLNEYLKVIFPEITDWVHDKGINKKLNGVLIKSRPDYRSDTLMLIIEFDGIQHYTKPDIILKDISQTDIYQKLGYKVVRIPYFIQLTNEVVKKLFGVEVKETLFDSNIPSLGASAGAPAYLCNAGLKRMAKVFTQFPKQYKTNIQELENCKNEDLTGCNLLKEEYAKLVNQK